VRPAEVVRRGADYLARHDVESPLASAEQLMMLVLGTDRVGVYARADGLRAAEAKAFGRALCRRCTGTPLQHLTGIAGFRGLDLVVRPGVFVPRPETEVLVGVALETLARVDHPVVVDVGTGTGAVALALKSERRDAVVHAVDISQDAVALALQNAERLCLEVHVLRGDLLEPLPTSVRPDLIVSNLPYVPLAEAAGLPPEVLADPREAVFGEADLYRRLFRQAGARLEAGGRVAVEIHEDAAAAVTSLASASGFVDVHVTKDLAGRDRVLAGRRP
jgi:release factor glutamine methyltransferase